MSKPWSLGFLDCAPIKFSSRSLNCFKTLCYEKLQRKCQTHLLQRRLLTHKDNNILRRTQVSLGTNHKASGSKDIQTSNASGANYFAMPDSTQEGRGFPYVTPLPSCLIPESFIGTNDFGKHLQQFNTTALMSGFHSNTNDNRAHYFALRLKENAFHFYATLSFEQQTNFWFFAGSVPTELHNQWRHFKSTS